MKTRNYALLFAMASIGLFGCSLGNSPEKSATAFMQHLQNLEPTKAKEYADINTSKLLNFMESAIGNLSAKQKDGFKALFKLDEISTKAQKCTTQENTAQCLMCCDANGNTYTLDLVLQEGKWLVSMKEALPFINLNMQGLVGGMKTIAKDIGEGFGAFAKEMSKQMNNPEFKEMQENLLQQMNSPEFREMQENLLKQMNSPEFREMQQNMMQDLKEMQQQFKDM